VEERPRTGLVIAGAIVVGVPYLIGVSAISADHGDNGTGWLWVPALGPWMALAERRRCTATDADGVSECTGDVFARMALIMDGIVQTAGATLLVVGLAVPKKVLVRQDPVQISVIPVRSGSVLGVRGSF
jgi:hypothetical protein